MLSAKKFAANLRSIRLADEAFREMVAESLAFAIFHARNHGQKTPFMDLCDAVPGWLKGKLEKVPVGKKKIGESEAESEASFRVAEWFASHEQQKAIRNANRKAKAKPEAAPPEPAPEAAQEPSADAAPLVAPGTIESEAIEVHDALVFHGEVLEVSADEATLLAAYLTQLRMEARKAA